MKLNDIVARVNTLLAGERHSYRDLVIHLDAAIDDINAQLNATFPAFSELPVGTDTYDFFPDRYIRTAVATGAAWYYFVTDEEGEMVSQQYTFNYERNLFVMVRDYLALVPMAYRADLAFDDLTGEYYYTPDVSLRLNDDMEKDRRGVVIDATYIIP